MLWEEGNRWDRPETGEGQEADLSLSHNLSAHQSLSKLSALSLSSLLVQVHHGPK